MLTHECPICGGAVKVAVIDGKTKWCCMNGDAEGEVCNGTVLVIHSCSANGSMSKYASNY